MVIYFYSKNENYSEFSNFAQYGIEMDGKWYPTVEHYFQAQKFFDEKHCEKIRKANTPGQAKKLGRSRKVKLRKDWESVKVDIMRKAVLKKFETHDELRELLLSTGEEKLVEDAPHDTFWGAGKNQTGQNWLGRILMEVREILREREE